MPYFTTQDHCRLYYTLTEPSPRAPAVIFLNGLAQTTTYWHSQTRFFAEDYRVLRYDGRAQGRSDIGGEPLTEDRHVADLRTLCDHLGIESANLVGLSHGAYIAAAFAVRHPERIARLVVCNLRAGPLWGFGYRKSVAPEAYRGRPGRLCPGRHPGRYRAHVSI